MSMNHLSSEKLWWMESATKEPVAPMLSQNGLFDFNQNQEENKQRAQDADDNYPNKEVRNEIIAERESMFEKPLTPSDVGKLNRLVIPKQHAERYFPIGGSGNDSVEKGLLLSFEDELGKLWRFRYSYWNSSQSYVLTKGWSRFVKEKRLQAGDIVMFERFRNEGDRFLIGWRRRNTVVAQPAGEWTPALYSGHPYPSHNSRPNGPPLPYQPHCLHAERAASSSAGVQNQITSCSSGNSSRTLRLFGVDLECQLDEPLGAVSPNHQLQGEPQYYLQSSSNASTSHHVSHYQNHVQDINFLRDASQTRHHQE